jgi:magnesium and cobalt transporter
MPDELPPSTSSTSLTAWWSRIFHGRDEESTGRQEIEKFLDECRHRELIAADEYAMLQGVLEVSEIHVREIMVPRSRMVVLPQDEPFDELLKIIVDSGHSRFPVIGADRDEVVGILLAKDLLKHFREHDAGFEIGALLRPAVFIPESKRLNTLLAEFRESHHHMAIVVDEYGGVSGLATIEDVLEQIVGSIDDEHDPAEAEYIQDQGSGRYLVLALTRIETFNEHFGVDLSDEEYETIGGLVMHELGRLPRRGESLNFGGFRFKVVRGDRRRVHTVEVVRVEAAPDA